MECDQARKSIFCRLTQSESLHPLGGRWRVAPDEGYLGRNAAVLRPHQSPAVTAVPLFVTFGDISPRRGENLSLPGEVFIRKIDFRGDQVCRKKHTAAPARRGIGSRHAGAAVLYQD